MLSVPNTIHVVTASSADRAEQARACYALGYHAEIYTSVEEFLGALPEKGIVMIVDEPESGGVTTLIACMSQRGVWLPVIAT